MNYYDKELQALKRSGRFRSRRIFDASLVDCASNDYLGFAEDKTLAQEAFGLVEASPVYGPKASMLVNGYHELHQRFEKRLCEVNGFESGIVVGSGFSANIAMIEALVRKGDELFIDALYHASGQLASRLLDATVTTFEHNSSEDLHRKLKASKARRKIIAVEGIYSMDGDLLNPDIIAIADEFEAILIVDEAHSSGVVGPNLLGVLDLYDVKIKANHIKMGTLGKAYGSFGAYILASEHIITYLVNRAKPVIYATAPSLYDTAAGLCALERIISHKEELGAAVSRRRQIVREILGLDMPGLIVPVEIGDNRKVIEIQEVLQEKGYLVGAIRQPTVERAILRLIARVGVSEKDLHQVCEIISSFR